MQTLQDYFFELTGLLHALGPTLQRELDSHDMEFNTSLLKCLLKCGNPGDVFAVLLNTFLPKLHLNLSHQSWVLTTSLETARPAG